MPAPPDANEPSKQEAAVILGGGPCGLYAALVLARAGLKVVVIEKEDCPGGLAAGHRRGSNYYDFGVHMLHSFDQEIFENVKEIMGDHRIEVSLKALIKWAGSFYRYPLQFNDMIKGMPPILLARCCVALLAYQAFFKFFPRTPKDAEEALIQLYGRPLYEVFFKEFTTKYWGIAPDRLSAAFITKKMPRLTAVDVIKKALTKIGIKDRSVLAVESALAEETLHYSRTGAESMPRLIAEEVEREGGELICNADVCGVSVDHDRVTSVSYRQRESGLVHNLSCDELISTIPVKSLVSALGDGVPDPIRSSADQLRSKAITVYGLLVQKEKCLDALYVYYRDKIFHRVGEPKNAGLIVDPPDHTVLIVEMTCEPDDPKWNGDASAKDAVFGGLEEEDICTPDQIVECHVLRTLHGYPIFDLGFDEHLDRVNGYFARLGNFQSTGRQGGFCYPNMHSAMRMGAGAAEKILSRS